MEDQLPVGWYELEDGRQVYGMTDFEVRAAARDGWRRQQAADLLLAQKLAAARPAAVAAPAPARPLFQTGDLFGGGDSSPRTDAQRGSEDGPYRATPARHGRM